MNNLPHGVSVSDPNIDPLPEGRTTSATYRINIGGGHYDYIDRWTCPICSFENEENIDGDESLCGKCKSLISLDHIRGL